MMNYHIFWSPTGQRIATVQARDARAACRKAPHPYRRYLGEIYAKPAPSEASLADAIFAVGPL